MNPRVQLKRDQQGLDLAYSRFVQRVVARFPGVRVIDGRHSGYPQGVFVDSVHMDHDGACALDRLTIPRSAWEFGTMIAPPSLGDHLREITIMAKPLLLDELWEVIEPLLPK